MIVTRFAPSPTGHLHIGHAFAAMTAHDTARAASGKFLVRMENIDGARSRSEFETSIQNDLAWLGLRWDGPIVRQSERLDAYRTALDRLRAKHLLYPCFCTRAEIATEIARAVDAPHGPEGPIYPGTCRDLSEHEKSERIASGASYALRLNAAKAAGRLLELTFEERGSGPNGESGTIDVDPLLFGDVVLARKDTPSAYHLAVVIDDAFQGVTLVTRGDDLFASTHVQRLLQALLDLPTPRYAHHRLILDDQGRKFSKRNASVTLENMRLAGVTPGAVRARLF